MSVELGTIIPIFHPGTLIPAYGLSADVLGTHQCNDPKICQSLRTADNSPSSVDPIPRSPVCHEAGEGLVYAQVVMVIRQGKGGAEATQALASQSIDRGSRDICNCSITGTMFSVSVPTRPSPDHGYTARSLIHLHERPTT